jgi:hypothetical protein
MRSTSCLAIARPRPVPPYFLVAIHLAELLEHRVEPSGRNARRTPVLSTGYFRPPRSWKITSPSPIHTLPSPPRQPRRLSAAAAYTDSSPVPDQRTIVCRLSREDIPLCEQLSGSRQRVLEVGEAVCVAVDFEPFECAAVARNVQLRQAVLARDVQFVRGARTHFQERRNFGILRGTDLAPVLRLGVKLPQAVFHEHHHTPSGGHRREHPATCRRRKPYRPLPVPVLFERVYGGGPQGTAGGGVHPLGGRPVGLRVAARIRYAGNAVAVEEAHREYRAMPEVGTPSQRHTHGIRIGLREAVAHSPGAPQETVIGMEHPCPGPKGQESEEHPDLEALLHSGEPLCTVILQSILQAVALASRATNRQIVHC